MNAAYADLLARTGADTITHLGLVQPNGREIVGVGYERRAVQWTPPLAGEIRVLEDLVFLIPPGVAVAGWRGYDAPEHGRDYGGQDLPPEVFQGPGQYTLLADETGIAHG